MRIYAAADYVMLQLIGLHTT